MEPASESYTQLLKILLMGDSASKKRTLLKIFLGEGTMNDVTLLGLDYKLKDVAFNDKKLRLQIWDTAGQERFRSVTASYYRGSQGALLICSTSEAISFLNIQYWLDEIKNYAPPQFYVLLVAVSSDEVQSVTLETIRGFADDKKLPLVECNLERQGDVNSAFMQLIQGILANDRPKPTVVDSIVLDVPKTPNSQPCPC